MKKILCVTICLLMILSAFVVPVTASENTTEDAVLHFDTNTTSEIWGKFDEIYCHIWEYGGDAFYPWGNKNGRCTDADGDGIYTYNLTQNGITLKDNTQYACIFYTNTGNQHCDLLFDSTVLGDTAYCTGEYRDSPEDIKYYFAYWRNEDPKKHGPELEINSIGQVLGTCIPMGKTAATIFEDALINILEDARIYSAKTDQQIIDDMACSLDLSKEQVERSLEKTGIVADWSSELSSAKTEIAVLHFDTSTAPKIWGKFDKIYCHIWEYGGDSFYPWGNKEQLCSDTDGDGIYTYNLTEHNITLKDNTQYGCIFYATPVVRPCHELLFDSTVLGDTAYCTGEFYEGAEDMSNNFIYFTYWRKQDPKKHGPHLKIDSIGRVLGTCIPQGMSAINLFENALVDIIDNARLFSGQSDQKIIDHWAYKLELSSEQVQQAIENSGEKIEWKKELSIADKIVGDADLDGEVSILDATQIQLYLASLVEFSEEQLLLADIDFYSGVTILDATQIQKKLAGYIFY